MKIDLAFFKQILDFQPDHVYSDGFGYICFDWDLNGGHYLYTAVKPEEAIIQERIKNELITQPRIENLQVFMPKLKEILKDG